MPTGSQSREGQGRRVGSEWKLATIKQLVSGQGRGVEGGPVAWSEGQRQEDSGKSSEMRGHFEETLER